MAPDERSSKTSEPPEDERGGHQDETGAPDVEESDAEVQTPAPPPGAEEERPVKAALTIGTLAALGLAGVYIAGGQPQAEGALLFVSLGSIGVGLILWAKRLLPQGEVTEARGDLPSTEEEREAVRESVGGDEPLVTRRKALIRLMAAAGGALGLAAVFPIRSLGPNPGRSLEHTAWKEGLRLVDTTGRPVRADTVEIDSVLTVLPEGKEHAGDSAAMLVRVEEDRLHPRPGRESWSPEGNVAYSKVCPHVGCPVGLYQADTHELVCPCHQSTFDVLDGARPTFGPATRSLPQLPLKVDHEGFLVAGGDFNEPVGPGYWNRE